MSRLFKAIIEFSHSAASIEQASEQGGYNIDGPGNLLLIDDHFWLYNIFLHS